MNAQPTETNALSSPRRPSWTRWPGWIGYVTAVWSATYGLLGLLWALGGAGFPFGVEHDPHAEVSVLESADPATTGAVIALLGLTGAAVAVVMVRQARRSLRGLLWFAWSISGVLVLLIPDGRLLIAVIRAPMVLIGRPLGLTDIGFAEYREEFWPWSVANQAVLILGGVLWAATAIGFRRRLADACIRCGRSRTGQPGWTAPEAAARWGRWAVAVAVAVPVGYAATRWAWALDIPLGVTQEALDSEAAESPGIWWAGAILATMALGGAVLTLGLVQKWGEVYPRWIPHLSGRRVRERTAVIPASLVAILITSTGLTNIRAHTLGGYDIEWEAWGMYAPQMFFPLWGAALGAATLAYHLRRRGRCGACGRGSPEPVTGPGSSTTN